MAPRGARGAEEGRWGPPLPRRPPGFRARGPGGGGEGEGAALQGGDPLGLPGPHRRRPPPLRAPHLGRPLPPRTPGQRRLRARRKARASWRGPAAGVGGGAREAERPAPRTPSPAGAARSGRRVWNNTVRPGSSSETTPQPVPSHFPGRPAPQPPPRHPALRTHRPTCDSPGCPGRGPKAGTREEEVDARVRRGETRTPGSSLGPAAARHHGASLPRSRLPALRGGGCCRTVPLLESAPGPPSLGNHTHAPNSKEVPPVGWRRGSRGRAARWGFPERSGSPIHAAAGSSAPGSRRPRAGGAGPPPTDPSFDIPIPPQLL